MAKFLVYCMDCSEEFESNSRRAKCSFCGSKNTHADSLTPKPVREGRREWMENSPRRQF